MYKTEPHLHVQEISACSHLCAADMVKMYYDAGYKTIFISDHFMPYYFNSLGDITWHDKVTIFLSGYYKAREAGKKYGMNVLLSAEVSFDDSPNHYLVYGITKEFLEAFPDWCYRGTEHFSGIAKSNNIFVVQAHPYRDGECFPTPGYADAFEVYNSSPRHNDSNDMAEKCAKQHGLYMTAGSDAHRAEDVAKGGILTETEICSTDDYIKVVKSGSFQVFKG